MRNQVNSLIAFLIILDRQPSRAPKLQLLPLHAGLSTSEQLAVFSQAEEGMRKIVLATNIAEVSFEARL